MPWVKVFRTFTHKIHSVPEAYRVAELGVEAGSVYRCDITDCQCVLRLCFQDENNRSSLCPRYGYYWGYYLEDQLDERWPKNEIVLERHIIETKLSDSDKDDIKRLLAL